MVTPRAEPMSHTELGNRCRTASDAYDVASRAVDAGQRRNGGATAAEYKAEFDARIELRHARKKFLASARAFTAESSASHAITRHALDRPSRIFRPHRKRGTGSKNEVAP
jgi:hypothetical protein